MAFLHFQNFVCVHHKNCEMNKSIIIAPSLLRRICNVEKFNGFSKVIQSVSENSTPDTQLSYLQATDSHSESQVNESISSRLKLRQLSFRPLIKPFVCFSATCSFSSSLSDACLLAKKKDINSVIQLVFEIPGIKQNHSLRSIQMII